MVAQRGTSKPEQLQAGGALEASKSSSSSWCCDSAEHKFTILEPLRSVPISANVVAPSLRRGGPSLRELFPLGQGDLLMLKLNSNRNRHSSTAICSPRPPQLVQFIAVQFGSVQFSSIQLNATNLLRRSAGRSCLAPVRFRHSTEPAAQCTLSILELRPFGPIRIRAPVSLSLLAGTESTESDDDGDNNNNTQLDSTQLDSK